MLFKEVNWTFAYKAQMRSILSQAEIVVLRKAKREKRRCIQENSLLKCMNVARFHAWFRTFRSRNLWITFRNNISTIIIYTVAGEGSGRNREREWWVPFTTFPVQETSNSQGIQIECSKFMKMLRFYCYTHSHFHIFHGVYVYTSGLAMNIIGMACERAKKHAFKIRALANKRFYGLLSWKKAMGSQESVAATSKPIKPDKKWAKYVFRLSYPFQSNARPLSFLSRNNLFPFVFPYSSTHSGVYAIYTGQSN